MDIVQRIMNRVKVNPETGCWEWQGGVGAHGYGRIGCGPRRLAVHRVMYEAIRGTIPQGNLVCHTCDNTSCCNPLHLFTGTQKDNMADMYRKGRGPVGARHGSRTQPERFAKGGNRKLTEDAVKSIRLQHEQHEKSGGQLAQEYGVTSSTIRRIIRGARWKQCSVTPRVGLWSGASEAVIVAIEQEAR